MEVVDGTIRDATNHSSKTLSARTRQYLQIIHVTNHDESPKLTVIHIYSMSHCFSYLESNADAPEYLSGIKR